MKTRKVEVCKLGEYLKDLTYCTDDDHELRVTTLHIMDGVNDLIHSRFSDKSILDIAEEE